MARKVTLKEIAREVGLSPTSVSLVLNNRPNKVSAANRKRIVETARRMRYVPNQIARSLVTRHSRTLGLVVPNIESRFFSALAKRLELRCRKEGYALFIMNSDDRAENDRELVGLLTNRGVDGIFLVPSNETEPDRELVEDLSLLPVPYVMVDRFIEGVSCDQVRFDNRMGGYLATRRLLDAGHERIACIVNTASITGRERLRGYTAALAERGIALDPGYVFRSAYYVPEAYAAALDVLATDATAVFASSDNIALGLLKRLYERGLRVPRDMSVVSYDNIAADAIFEPSLTSIEQDVDKLADHAVRLMAARIEDGDDPGASPIQRVLEPRLVEQDSVAPPAQGGPYAVRNA